MLASWREIQILIDCCFVVGAKWRSRVWRREMRVISTLLSRNENKVSAASKWATAHVGSLVCGVALGGLVMVAVEIMRVASAREA